MKLLRKPGATSVLVDIFIRDSSSASGAGLTGLVFNTASLTAYYHRNKAASAVAISLVTATVGTFTSSGFKEIDSTNMPGWYQLGIPDAAFASGAESVSVMLKGATNMVPTNLEIDLESHKAVLDGTDTLETGLSPYQWMRMVGAVLAQITSGGGTATRAFRNFANTRTRGSGTVEADGDRPAVSWTDLDP